MSNIKKNFGYTAVALAIVGAGTGVYLINHPAPTPNPVATAISDVAAGKATLIDVRTPEEYAARHAKGAINLNSVDVQAGKVPDLAKDTKIYLYCRTGHRAGIVLTALKQAGFTDVTSLGGLQAWVDAGGPQA